MSRKKQKGGYKVPSRPTTEELGMSKSRRLELEEGCRAGKYPLTILRKACSDLEFIEPWILLSVTKGKSFDAMRVKWELGEMERPPVGKSDFYGFRRIFYSNLDKALREKEAANE